ncbi:MAG: glutathione S-transferase N-terminal domain-containing protein, partial [Bacteriovoracaceae bacterium]|nr:glutathione S-transferase N-terminal domain-containing protein [Bacteriovoracaceae bacterium]
IHNQGLPMSNYTLVGSTTSPFVRKLRIFMHYNQIPFEFKSINYLEAKDSEYLKSHNPLNKIPFLLIDEKILFDSRVIYNYFSTSLITQGRKKSDSLEDENATTEIDGFLETAVNLFALRRGGLDIESRDNSYVVRQKERIELILNALEKWTTNSSTSKEWNYQTMSLYCALEWANFREMINLQTRPLLGEFQARFKDSPFVEETKIIVPV